MALRAEGHSALCRRNGEEGDSRNLSARRVWFGCGTKDDARTNGRNRLSAKQGVSRYARHRMFAEYVKGFPSWAAKTSFRDIPGVAHTGKVWDDPPLLDTVISFLLTPQVIDMKTQDIV